MHIFFWFLLFLLVVAGVVIAVRSSQQRRERERLWGALKDEPSFPGWNEDSLGVSSVRERLGVSHLPEDEALAGPVPDPVPTPEPVLRAEPEPEPAPTPEPEPLAAPADEALLDETTEPPAPKPALDPEPSETAPETPPADGPRPMRQRTEWWEDDAPGTGPLLRSLVEATGGSAALVRPDPSDDGYLVLAAAGPASSALHSHRMARRFSATVLTELPREPVTVILGSDESGLLPGMDPDGVGETAVRALVSPPAPRRLLVVDVPSDHPLDSRTERLLERYADLLAEVLGLPTTPPPPEPPSKPADPIVAAMEVVAEEMATSRETARSMALALVVPYDHEDLLSGDPDDLEQHERALRERIETVTGTRMVEPMGALVFGAVCDAEPGQAERWARALAESGPRLRIGMAIYGPRHVSPDFLRQDAAHALHQTYAGDDTCVIVE